MRIGMGQFENLLVFFEKVVVVGGCAIGPGSGTGVPRANAGEDCGVFAVVFVMEAVGSASSWSPKSKKGFAVSGSNP